MILTPVFVWLWEHWKKQPSAPGKFATGLVLQAFHTCGWLCQGCSLVPVAELVHYGLSVHGSWLKLRNADFTNWFVNYD